MGRSNTNLLLLFFLCGRSGGRGGNKERRRRGERMAIVSHVEGGNLASHDIQADSTRSRGHSFLKEERWVPFDTFFSDIVLRGG